MTQPNAFISNGTCYSGANQRASSRFLPCGNDFFGRQTCCQAGDVCLSDLACYNGEFGVTYLAGCTDPEYGDKACPDKNGWSDQPWAGLVYCNGTSNEWVACQEKRKDKTLTSADACWCPKTSRTVAFSAPSTLENTASLPASPLGSLGFYAGYVPSVTLPNNNDDDASTTLRPTATPSVTPTGGSSPSSTSTTTTRTSATATAPPAGPPPPSSSSSEGLSTGARAGIGIGAAAGGLVLLAALAFLFLQRRRRRQRDSLAASSGTGGEYGGGDDKLRRESSSNAAGSGGAGGPRAARTETPATSVVSELDSRAARPWSMRSELADTPHPVRTPTAAGQRPTGLSAVDEEGAGGGGGNNNYVHDGGGGGVGGGDGGGGGAAVQKPPQWGHAWRKDQEQGQGGPVAELPG